MSNGSPAPAAVAEIGPNAVIQTVAALRECIGEPATGELLATAELSRYATSPPVAMIPEDDVVTLFRTLRASLDTADAGASSRLAGFKTADYILANRIPRPVQWLLRALPARFAAPLLMSAIAKHTWTFAGSGTVSVLREPLRVSIESCPICRGSASDTPVCAYYAASFEGLFRQLVSSRAAVTETQCAATGAPACVFEVRY